MPMKKKKKIYIYRRHNFHASRVWLPPLPGCVAAQMNPRVLHGSHRLCMLNNLKLEFSSQLRFQTDVMLFGLIFASFSSSSLASQFSYLGLHQLESYSRTSFQGKDPLANIFMQTFSYLSLALYIENKHGLEGDQETKKKAQMKPSEVSNSRYYLSESQIPLVFAKVRVLPLKDLLVRMVANFCL